jgi:hypothetical protein
MHINDLIGRQMIAWLWEKVIADGRTLLFLSPQYYKDANSVWIPFSNSEAEFPTEGCVFVKPAGGYDAADIIKKYGHLVFASFNNAPFCDTTQRNCYSALCNPDYQRGTSQLELMSFSTSALIQIIDVNIPYETVYKNKGFYSLDDNILTSIILIKTPDGNCFGPFSIDIKGNFVELSVDSKQKYMIGKFTLDKLKKSVLSLYQPESRNTQYSLLNMSLLSLFEYAETKYDWISDSTLLDAVTKILKNTEETEKLSSNQVRQIKSIISNSMKDYNEFEITDERRSRIENMINILDEKHEFLQTISYNLLETESITEKIIDIICNNYFNKIESKITAHSFIQKSIIEKQDELTKLQQELVTLNENKSALVQQEKSKFQQDIDMLKHEITELQSQREELVKIVSLGSTIQELVVKQASLRSDIEKQQKELDQTRADKILLEYQLNNTLATFSDQSKTIAKALDNKLLDRVLKTVGGEDIDGELEDVIFDVQLTHSSMKAEEIIDYGISFVSEQANRDVTRNDIINYLICITQGFITTFAGEPGTGKTSLCNIIAKALGLARNDKYSRFVELPVERGWTSHKDYIGYFNPLTKNLEYSNREIFDAIKLLNKEYECSNSIIAPYIILLDEANLSPIEHYWATFLKNCDSDSSANKTINLGGKYIWHIPNHLRFLATVNFDHTTEELSPRFLDRSWIIVLEPSQIVSESLSMLEVKNSERIISFNDLNDAFNSFDTHSELEELMAVKWESIQKVFKNYGKQIMPRSAKMVINYSISASKYMKKDSPDTRFAPLDYAVAQKILPTINGYGELYKKLVEELINECAGMPLCLKYLNNIKRQAADNMGYYQFFIRK